MAVVERDSEDRAGGDRDRDREALLSLDEVAQQLRVSRSTVHHHIRDGRLRAVNVGSGDRRRTLRIRPEDLRDFLEHRETQAQPRLDRRTRRRAAAKTLPDIL